MNTNNQKQFYAKAMFHFRSFHFSNKFSCGNKSTEIAFTIGCEVLKVSKIELSGTIIVKQLLL